LAGLKLQAERASCADSLETMQPALAHIRHAADRVARLSTQLLVLARSESSSQGSPELQALDLVELARDACVEWAPKALERGMDLAFEGTAETLTIAGEPTLLRELLNNLFDNALRYGRAGGTTVVAVSGHPDITLSVEDDGPGMSLDEAGRATERFYRIPGSPGDGCGLGLAIVKEIADMHHARLRIGGTVPAGGTRIELAFPKQTPNLPEARPERRAPG
jgi:two-component system sensor histidine kinase TctE